MAHRDYTDNSSVQVMLFADRLEVMNSGRLPPSLTVDKLRVPHQSLPGNPLLAESMYLLQYIERMGTGTVDMIRRCAEAGLPEPEFEVGAGFVTRIWRARDAIQTITTRSGSARKQPENSQKGTSPTRGSLTASSSFSAGIRRPAAAKSLPRSGSRNPPFDTAWTSCARQGELSGLVPTRAATGTCWITPSPIRPLPTLKAPSDREWHHRGPYATSSCLVDAGHQPH